MIDNPLDPAKIIKELMRRLSVEEGYILTAGSLLIQEGLITDNQLAEACILNKLDALNAFVVALGVAPDTALNSINKLGAELKLLLQDHHPGDFGEIDNVKEIPLSENMKERIKQAISKENLN